MNTKKFYIKHFDDYHEINDTLNYKAIELGCFPPKKGYGYCRYFALFYKGRTPSVNNIMSLLCKKVAVGKPWIHCGTGEDVGVTYDDLRYEVEQNIIQSTSTH